MIGTTPRDVRGIKLPFVSRERCSSRTNSIRTDRERREFDWELIRARRIERLNR
jgi:hypothetical protein